MRIAPGHLVADRREGLPRLVGVVARDWVHAWAPSFGGQKLDTSKGTKLAESERGYSIIVETVLDVYTAFQ